jgi:hypothetical protein
MFCSSVPWNLNRVKLLVTIAIYIEMHNKVSDKTIRFGENIMSIHRKSAIATIVCCLFSCIATAANAQAYVNQTSAGEKSAYISQTPPTARQNPIPAPSARQTASVGGKIAKNSARAVKNPLPTVGQGSSATVKIEAEAEAWPTVGRGAVNR